MILEGLNSGMQRTSVKQLSQICTTLFVLSADRYNSQSDFCGKGPLSYSGSHIYIAPQRGPGVQIRHARRCQPANSYVHEWMRGTSAIKTSGREGGRRASIDGGSAACVRQSASGGSVTCVAIRLSIVGISCQDVCWWFELMVDSATIS